jgi:hypothetical protein
MKHLVVISTSRWSNKSAWIFGLWHDNVLTERTILDTASVEYCIAAQFPFLLLISACDAILEMFLPVLQPRLL